MTNLSVYSHLMRSLFSLAAVATLGMGIGGAAGCSTTDSGSAAGGADASTLSVEAQTWAKDFCAVFAPCCAAIENPPQSCATSTEALIAAGTFDAARASTCLGAVREAAKDPFFCGRNRVPSSCFGIFGTKKEGEACDVDANCATVADGWAHCVPDTSTGTPRSVCRSFHFGQAGEPCGYTLLGDRVEPANSHATRICDASKGLFCDFRTSTCTARAALGATCANASSAAACVDGAYCGRSSGKCEPKAAAGAPCDYSDPTLDDSVACAAGSYCGDKQTCVPVATVGTACSTGGIECGRTPDALTCTNGACAKDPLAYGGACAGVPLGKSGPL